MWKIKGKTAESISIAAQNTYPNEFMALLGGNKKEKKVEELVVLPAIYGKNFSSLRTDLVPFDSSILGSVHSHPSKNNFPSNADLGVFAATGEIHLIIAYPFGIENIRAFARNGKETEFQITEH